MVTRALSFIQALLDFVTTMGYVLAVQTVTKSNKLHNQIKLHHQNMTFGIGKTVTESNMSHNQIVTKSNNA